MSLLRRTAILSGVVLVLGLGIGMLIFRDTPPPVTEEGTPPAVNAGADEEHVEQANVNTAVPETTVVPALSDAEEIKAAATIFSERFWSYHENARELALTSTEAFLTPQNLARLEGEAVRIAERPDVENPETYVAHVLSVAIISRTDEHATVDVTMNVETWAGQPFTRRAVDQQTHRLLLTKIDQNWKIANAAF